MAASTLRPDEPMLPDDSRHSSSQADTPPTSCSDVEVNSQDDDPNEDDYNYQDYRITCVPLLDFIEKRRSGIDSSSDGPNQNTDFSNFKAFWYGKFDDLRTELATSQQSKLFLTDPPLKVLEVEILDDGVKHECPCCLENRPADVIIREDAGITWDDFVKALRNTLYGSDVTHERMPLENRQGGRLVLKNWDYMRQNGDEFYRGSSYDNVRIWAYCVGF